MRFNKYIVISFILIFNYSYSCKCEQLEKETMIDFGLKRADIVFYGELIKSDSLNMTYSFKIIEVFKGKFSNKIINGISQENNCDLFPMEKGLWIVYGNFNSDNTISLSICSPTQSMIFGPLKPPPPLKMNNNGKFIKLNDFEIDLYELRIENKTFNNFIYQLEKLRQYKLEQKNIIEESELDNKNKIIIVSLLVNALLLLTLLILIVSKKYSNNRITK